MFSTSTYSQKLPRPQYLQQLQRSNETLRCQNKYLKERDFINFKKIKEDFDIGFFDFRLKRYINNAEYYVNEYKGKCENLSHYSNDKNKKKCESLKLQLITSLKIAYNILSIYLTKKTLKRITKVANKPYDTDRINKLVCSLNALAALNKKTEICPADSTRFQSIQTLINMFSNKFKDNNNMHKLADVFIKSLLPKIVANNLFSKFTASLILLFS